MRFGRNYLLSMVDNRTGQRSLLRRFWLYRNAKRTRDIMMAEVYGTQQRIPRFSYNIHRHFDY